MPLNIDFQQIFLHLFNFVILFAILYLLLYKPVKDFMDKRTAHYEELDAKAKADLAAAAEAKESCEERLAGVEDEIARRRSEAAAQAEETRRAAVKQAEDEAKKLLADARRNAEEECARMKQEAEGEIVELVAAAAEKLVGQSTTAEAFDRFLDAAKRSDPDA